MPDFAGSGGLSVPMSRLTAALDTFPWLKTAREVALFAHRRGREVRLQQVAGSLTFTTVLSIVPLFAVAPRAVFSAFRYLRSFARHSRHLCSGRCRRRSRSTVLRLRQRIRAAGNAADGGRPDLPRPDGAGDDHDRGPRAERRLAGARSSAIRPARADLLGDHHAGPDSRRCESHREFISLVALGQRPSSDMPSWLRRRARLRARRAQRRSPTPRSMCSCRIARCAGAMP